MKKQFGTLPTGEQANLYTISCGGITAAVTDFGANLVSLLVPGRDGTVADVVLGYDNPKSYLENGGCLGAVVGARLRRMYSTSLTLLHTLGLPISRHISRRIILRSSCLP